MERSDRCAGFVVEIFYGISGFLIFLLILGEDEFFLTVFVSTFYITMVYWTIAGIYLFMDLTLKPAFLRKYKVQPNMNSPLDKAKLFQVSFDDLDKKIFEQKTRN